jgi:hypothetical protein
MMLPILLFLFLVKPITPLPVEGSSGLSKRESKCKWNPKPPPSSSGNAFQDLIINTHNTERRKVKVPEIKWSDSLAKSAYDSAYKSANEPIGPFIKQGVKGEIWTWLDGPFVDEMTAAEQTLRMWVA